MNSRLDRYEAGLDDLIGADYQEEQHPRDESGKFAPKGEGAEGTEKPSKAKPKAKPKKPAKPKAPPPGTATTGPPMPAKTPLSKDMEKAVSGWAARFIPGRHSKYDTLKDLAINSDMSREEEQQLYDMLDSGELDQRWAEETGKPVELMQWMDSLEAEEHEAIHEWTDTLFTDMRSIQIGRDTKEDPETVKRHVDNMEAALDRAPEFQGTVYRGARLLSDEQYQNIIGAKTIELKALSSSSPDKETAAGFLDPSIFSSGQGKTGRSILFEIEATSGADIAYLGEYAGEESEVVLRKGVRYEMVEVEEEVETKTRQGKSISHTVVKLREVKKGKGSATMARKTAQYDSWPENGDDRDDQDDRDDRWGDEGGDYIETDPDETVAGIKTANRYDQFKKIVDEQSFGDVDGQPFDTFTASAAVQIYEGISPEAQQKFEEMPMPQLIDVIMGMMSKFSSHRSFARLDAREEGLDDLIGDSEVSVLLPDGSRAIASMFKHAMSEIDDAYINQRAMRAWELMDENEQTAVRIGMSPLWTTQEDLGGKDPGGAHPQLEGDDFRKFSVALMDIADKQGGMIARKTAQDPGRQPGEEEFWAGYDAHQEVENGTRQMDTDLQGLVNNQNSDFSKGWFKAVETWEGAVYQKKMAAETVAQLPPNPYGEGWAPSGGQFSDVPRMGDEVEVTAPGTLDPPTQRGKVKWVDGDTYQVDFGEGDLQSFDAEQVRRASMKRKAQTDWGMVQQALNGMPEVAEALGGPLEGWERDIDGTQYDYGWIVESTLDEPQKAVQIIHNKLNSQFSGFQFVVEGGESHPGTVISGSIMVYARDPGATEAKLGVMDDYVVDQARDMGRAAWEKDDHRAPAQNPEIMELVERNPDQSTEILKAFLEGYDKANIGEFPYGIEGARKTAASMTEALGHAIDAGYTQIVTQEGARPIAEFRVPPAVDSWGEYSFVEDFEGGPAIVENAPAGTPGGLWRVEAQEYQVNDRVKIVDEPDRGVWEVNKGPNPVGYPSEAGEEWEYGLRHEQSGSEEGMFDEEELTRASKTAMDVWEQAWTISSGTMATLIGSSDYGEIARVQQEFAEWIKDNDRFTKWQDAWNEWGPAHGYGSPTGEDPMVERFSRLAMSDPESIAEEILAEIGQWTPMTLAERFGWPQDVADRVYTSLGPMSGPGPDPSELAQTITQLTSQAALEATPTGDTGGTPQGGGPAGAADGMFEDLADDDEDLELNESAKGAYGPSGSGGSNYQLLQAQNEQRHLIYVDQTTGEQREGVLLEDGDPMKVSPIDGRLSDEVVEVPKTNFLKWAQKWDDHDDHDWENIGPDGQPVEDDLFLEEDEMIEEAGPGDGTQLGVGQPVVDSRPSGQRGPWTSMGKTAQQDEEQHFQGLQSTVNQARENYQSVSSYIDMYFEDYPDMDPGMEQRLRDRILEWAMDPSQNPFASDQYGDVREFDAGKHTVGEGSQIHRQGPGAGWDPFELFAAYEDAQIGDKVMYRLSLGSQAVGTIVSERDQDYWNITDEHGVERPVLKTDVIAPTTMAKKAQGEYQVGDTVEYMMDADKPDLTETGKITIVDPDGEGYMIDDQRFIGPNLVIRKVGQTMPEVGGDRIDLALGRFREAIDQGDRPAAAFLDAISEGQLRSEEVDIFRDRVGGEFPDLEGEIGNPFMGARKQAQGDWGNVAEIEIPEDRKLRWGQHENGMYWAEILDDMGMVESATQDHSMKEVQDWAQWQGLPQEAISKLSQLDVGAPAEQLGQTLDGQWALYEQGGRYYKLPMEAFQSAMDLEMSDEEAREKFRSYDAEEISEQEMRSLKQSAKTADRYEDLEDPEILRLIRFFGEEQGGYADPSKLVEDVSDRGGWPETKVWDQLVILDMRGEAQLPVMI